MLHGQFKAAKEAPARQPVTGNNKKKENQAVCEWSGAVVLSCAVILVTEQGSGTAASNQILPVLETVVSCSWYMTWSNAPWTAQRLRILAPRW